MTHPPPDSSISQPQPVLTAVPSVPPTTVLGPHKSGHGDVRITQGRIALPPVTPPASIASLVVPELSPTATEAKTNGPTLYIDGFVFVVTVVFALY